MQVFFGVVLIVITGWWLTQVSNVSYGFSNAQIVRFLCPDGTRFTMDDANVYLNGNIDGFTYTDYDEIALKELCAQHGGESFEIITVTPYEDMAIEVLSLMVMYLIILGGLWLIRAITIYIIVGSEAKKQPPAR